MNIEGNAEAPVPLQEGQTIAPAPSTFIERHGISSTLFAILVLIAIFILYQGIGSIATVLLVGVKPSLENITGFRIATGIGEILFILIPVLAFTRLASLTPREYLRLRTPRVGTLVLPLAGIVSLQQLLQMYLYFQDRIPIPSSIEKYVQQFKELYEEAYRLLVTTHSTPELLFVITIVALVPALAEELMFRGLIQRSLERSSTPVRGAVVTGIIFGAYHLNPFSVVPLMVLGIYLGFLALRANSLWVSIFAHFCNNAIACIGVYFAGGDDLITGDPGTMSAPALLMTFAVSAIVFTLSTYYFFILTKPTVNSELTEKAPA